MGKPAKKEREQGFTMVELMIAMLVLAIVMTAIAPAFYGELKASAAANYRSTANGLAVGAIEQMRAFPFYQIGWNAVPDYSTTGSTALSCVSPSNTYQTGGTAPPWNSKAGLEPVELTKGSALDNVNNNLLTTQSISHVTFTTTRCVYWVGSSTGNTEAYKLTWVGVSWQVAGVNWHVSQTSAIYPGGEGKYAAKNNDTPGAPACTNQGGIPATPPQASLSATQDASSPTTTIDLTWSEGSDTTTVMPVQYKVNYSSTSASGPWVPFSQTGLPNQNVDGLASNTPYWFQIIEVACDGTPGVGAVVSQTTANSGQSCSYGSFSVTPANTATIGSSDQLDNIPYFTISVNVTSGCSNIAAYYSPKNDGTYLTDTAPSGSGTITWNTSANKWAAGTITFTLYVGGTATVDTTQVKITCDAKKC